MNRAFILNIIMRLKIFFKALLFTFFIIISTEAFAQNDTHDLKHLDSIAKKMFVDMNNRDYDAILDMTHPKVFEIVPRESMGSIFKSMFEGTDEFSIDIPKTIPEYKLSEIHKNEKDSLEYVFISYDLKMNMTFHKQEFDEESKKMMIPMMKAKGMDVKFISKNTMDVLMNDRITIILKDNSTNNKWVMVNYDPDSPLFYQIVSDGLLESAKEYKQDLMAESKNEIDN